MRPGRERSPSAVTFRRTWRVEDRPVAESALLVLLIETIVVSLLFIVIPLLIFKRRALSGQGRLRTLVAFACLGMAYIVALSQNPGIALVFALKKHHFLFWESGHGGCR